MMQTGTLPDLRFSVGDSLLADNCYTYDGNIQINIYDAEGLRAEMEENGRLAAFIFNPAKEVVTETEDRTVLSYVRGSELIARNTDAVRTYYHYASDEMGSITHVTDEEGNLLNRYEYDAWGNLTLEDEQVSNRFKYTGEQFDAITQQYYLRARFYNPALARFMQEDTYRGDGLNLYAYCANNPVRYVDPSGHWCEVKQNAYERLVKENGFDINNIDPDTKLRFMAEAANIVAGRNVGRGDTVIELPGLVLPEENQPSRPGADVPKDGRHGERGINSEWWHEGYVDDLSDIQILLGVKQSDKGLSTLGSSTRENAMSAGQAWVGDNYNVIKDRTGNVLGYSSSDGIRAFRIQYKPKEGMWRANFQENIMVNNPYPNPGQHSSQLKNVHIDILN